MYPISSTGFSTKPIAFAATRNVFDKLSADKLACMPRRENDGCEETNYFYNCLQSELVSILGVSLQKNNIKVSEGTANAVGCLVDFQLVWIVLDKNGDLELFMEVLKKDRRMVEEGSPKGDEIDNWQVKNEFVNSKIR